MTVKATSPCCTHTPCLLLLLLLLSPACPLQESATTPTFKPWNSCTGPSGAIDSARLQSIGRPGRDVVPFVCGFGVSTSATLYIYFFLFSCFFVLFVIYSFTLIALRMVSMSEHCVGECYYSMGCIFWYLSTIVWFLYSSTCPVMPNV